MGNRFLREVSPSVFWSSSPVERSAAGAGYLGPKRVSRFSGTEACTCSARSFSCRLVLSSPHRATRSAPSFQPPRPPCPTTPHPASLDHWIAKNKRAFHCMLHAGQGYQGHCGQENTRSRSCFVLMLAIVQGHSVTACQAVPFTGQHLILTMSHTALALKPNQITLQKVMTRRTYDDVAPHLAQRPAGGAAL